MRRREANRSDRRSIRSVSIVTLRHGSNPSTASERLCDSSDSFCGAWDSPTHVTISDCTEARREWDFLPAGSRYENIASVRVISHRAIRELTVKHKAAIQPLDDWYRIAKRANWNNFAEVRSVYPHADLVGSCTVFNVGGNKYRLIAKLDFTRSVLYIRFILTHSGYDEGGWKNDCHR